MIKDGIEYVKCNECGRICLKLEMLDDKRMCKDCYIKWLETDFVKMRTKPLEQKIENLEKENAELRNNGFTVSAMTEQQLKVAIEKGEQLEKENAELTETLKTYNGCGDWDNDFHTCRVYLQHEELQEYIEQLIKAKEIIRELLSWESRADYDYVEYNLIKDKAEQFLKEIEK
jgi:hypothetical protein